jgi:hypothetical protein
MEAWKTQLLAQIKTIFEDDNFEEIMLEVITNELGKVEWSSMPKQHGGSKLGQFNNVEKIRKLGFEGSSKIFSLTHLLIMKSVHDGLE